MDPRLRLAAPLSRMLAALALLVSMAPPGPAHAGRGVWSVQRPLAVVESSTPRDAAAAEFAEGEAAYRDRDFVRAAEHFARAHDLVPHPSTLFNLAMAQERAGDSVAAWNTYDRLAKEALTPAERRDALAARDRMRPAVALLEIHASAHDAVCLDGEHVDVATHITLAMHPGTHEVRVGKQATRVALRAGDTHTVTLEQGALLEGTRRPARAVVPLLVASIVSSGAATGLGIAAATGPSPGVRQGLAAGAAAASGLALGTTITALVLRTRSPRKARRAPEDDTSSCSVRARSRSP
jgi:hypothetical protein